MLKKIKKERDLIFIELLCKTIIYFEGVNPIRPI